MTGWLMWGEALRRQPIDAPLPAFVLAACSSPKGTDHGSGALRTATEGDAEELQVIGS